MLFETGLCKLPAVKLFEKQSEIKQQIICDTRMIKMGTWMLPQNIGFITISDIHKSRLAFLYRLYTE